MEVKVTELQKTYGKTQAVRGISFSFSSGQIFGFIGPNGAGKSTTMRVLATLEEPTSGLATIDGVSVIEEPEKAHRLVGYVPDHLPSHRDITVHEYLDFFARAYGIRGEKRRQTVEGVEEFTNLLGIRDKTLNALSKGMKNRVSIARAIVHDPPVLLMDEPAAGLDPRARIELRELLKVLASQGKAILISSHILSELGEICNGAVIIERGRILRAGTLQDILSQSAQTHRTVLIRPLERMDELRTHVLETPGIENARQLEHAIEVDVQGGEEACADLLTNIVSAGFQIVEFRPRRVDLEHIFLSVTKGDVQ
ncbi:MAG TPA: ABC transporter ATP-binding protein [Gemmata sp.]|jgi:ABC-2 type transport system ATP-binding protein|nr:ABC transporter ATP-binding protein [Gemmata sp.]